MNCELIPFLHSPTSLYHHTPHHHAFDQLRHPDQRLYRTVQLSLTVWFEFRLQSIPIFFHEQFTGPGLCVFRQEDASLDSFPIFVCHF